MDVDISLQALLLALRRTLHSEAQGFFSFSPFYSSMYTSFMVFAATQLAIDLYPENVLEISVARDEHKAQVRGFKFDFSFALAELRNMAVADIRERCFTSRDSKHSKDSEKPLEDVDDLNTVASMFASTVLDSAFRSCSSCDKTLRFLSRRALQCSNISVSEEKMMWLCEQIVHTSRHVIVKICNGNYDRPPEKARFISEVMLSCHRDAYAVLAEEFMRQGPLNYFLVPTLLKLIVFSERKRMGSLS